MLPIRCSLNEKPFKKKCKFYSFGDKLSLTDEKSDGMIQEMVGTGDDTTIAGKMKKRLLLTE